MASRRRRTKRVETRSTRYEVVRLGKSREDAQKLGLNEGQVLELDEVVQRLDNFGIETEIWDLPIMKIDKGDGIYVLEHSGTSLGRTLVEVYFAPNEKRREIVVLGVAEGNRNIPRKWYRTARMRNRLEHYLRIAK